LSGPFDEPETVSGRPFPGIPRPERAVGSMSSRGGAGEAERGGRFFLFLTHGGSRIGGGHLSRCLALAGAFEELGVPCLWAVDPESRALLPEGAVALDREEDPFALGAEHLRSLLFGVPSRFSLRSSEGDGASEAPGSSARPGRGIRGILVDSYAPSLEWLRILAGKTPLVVIDDDRSRPVERVARVLINYNLNAEEIPYGESGWGEVRGAGGAPRLLLGPRYALIRPEVARLVQSRPLPRDGGMEGGGSLASPPKSVERIFPRGNGGGRSGTRFVLLVSGGADAAGVTEEVVRGWEEDLLPLRAVLGPRVAPERAERLMAEARGRENVRVLRAPADFPALLAEAELVACTSSVTAYEALALGRRLIVFQTAENQAGIGRKIGRMGWGIDLGRWGTGSCEGLRAAVRRPPDVPPPLVNPQGALEVAREVLRELRCDEETSGGG